MKSFLSSKSLLLAILFILTAAAIVLLNRNAHWRLAYQFLWITSPGGDFSAVGKPPDFSELNSWAAHPEKLDQAIFAPMGTTSSSDQNANAAVFYLHPTTFISRDSWNHPDPLAPDSMRDDLLLPNQASVFNGCCAIYAPKYRQATFYSFADKKGRGSNALNLAYSDIENAFDTFLEEIGPSMPIVLAGHSQGSAHLQRLIQERFQTPNLKRRLVVVYAPGYLIPPSALGGVENCATLNDTACVNSWNVVSKKSFIPNFFRSSPVYNGSSYRRHLREDAICTDPGLWTESEMEIGYLGGFYRSEDHGFASLSSVTQGECIDGFLVIDEPNNKRFREVMMSGGWYHVYEYALYWTAIRTDIDRRLKIFIDGKSD